MKGPWTPALPKRGGMLCVSPGLVKVTLASGAIEAHSVGGQEQGHMPRLVMSRTPWNPWHPPPSPSLSRTSLCPCREPRALPAFPNDLGQSPCLPRLSLAF